MNFKRIVAIVAVATLVAGCSCSRSRKIGDDNIGYAEGEGPLKDVHFSFDSSTLDGTAKSILTANAEWLKTNAAAKAQIEGHCDERGTNEYNMALGARRSQSAYDFLKSAGVDAARMSTISYGEELPLDPAHNESAWSKNRRAHSKVMQ